MELRQRAPSGAESRHNESQAVVAAASRVVVGKTAEIRLALTCLLGTHAVALWRVNTRWAAAGAEARAILTGLETHLARGTYTHLFVHGIPDTRDGIYVFRNGFETALRRVVGSDVQPSRISAAQWAEFASARRADPNRNEDVLLLSWQPDRAAFISP